MQLNMVWYRIRVLESQQHTPPLKIYRVLLLETPIILTLYSESHQYPWKTLGNHWLSLEAKGDLWSSSEAFGACLEILLTLFCLGGGGHIVPALTLMNYNF